MQGSGAEETRQCVEEGDVPVEVTSRRSAVIISYGRKFIFIHIHKTGGDSVSAALLPSLDSADYVLKNDWQAWIQNIRSGGRHSELVGLRKHSTALAVSRVLPPDVWNGSFKFAFVRHPVSRTVSLYRYAMRKADERSMFIPRNVWYLTRAGRRTDPRQWPSVRALREAPAFSDFIRHPLLDRDPSMASQWSSVSDEAGRLLVDFVGRFESLQRDFDHVQERLGLARCSLGRHNSSRRSEVIEVSPADRNYLASRFEDDYTQFGYDPASNT